MNDDNHKQQPNELSHISSKPPSRIYLPPMIDVRRSEQIDIALANKILNYPLHFDTKLFIKENSKHNVIERHIQRLIDERQRILLLNPSSISSSKTK